MSNGARRVAPLAVTVALALEACGGAGSPDEAVESFFAAVAEGDGPTACALLTEEGQERVLEGVLDTPSAGASCEDAVAEAPAEARAAAGEVQVEVTEESGSEATVEVTPGDEDQPVSLRVVSVDGEWQIDGLAIADVVI